MNELEERSNWLRRTAWLVMALTFIGGLSVLAYSALSGSPPPRPRAPALIQLVELPPPPPPPPEPEIAPPPEPEELVQDEVEIDEPTPAPESQAPEEAAAADPEPAPGPPGDGALDAEGEACAGANCLAARRGGSGLGTGGGGGGGSYGAYAFAAFKQALERERAIVRGDAFVVEVTVWIASDGRVERAEVTRSSGDAALDRRVREAVIGVGRLQPRRDAAAGGALRFRFEGRRA